MTSQPIRRGSAAAAVAGAFALAACGSGDDADTATAKATRTPEATDTPAATASPAPPAAAPAPEVLRGRWRRTIRTEDIGAIVLPLGVWRIDVHRRAMDVYSPRTKTVDFTMQLATEGRRLTLGPSPACTSPATYTWRATERRLRLAAEEDTCSARTAIFGGTWTR